MYRYSCCRSTSLAPCTHLLTSLACLAGVAVTLLRATSACTTSPCITPVPNKRTLWCASRQNLNRMVCTAPLLSMHAMSTPPSVGHIFSHVPRAPPIPLAKIIIAMRYTSLPHRDDCQGTTRHNAVVSVLVSGSRRGPHVLATVLWQQCPSTAGCCTQMQTTLHTRS